MDQAGLAMAGGARDQRIDERQSWTRLTAELESGERDLRVDADDVQQSEIVQESVRRLLHGRPKRPDATCKLGQGHARYKDFCCGLLEDLLDALPARLSPVVREKSRRVEQETIRHQGSEARSATNSATESRSGECFLPWPSRRRARSPRSGITRTRISSRPSTACQSSFQPGRIPSFSATSAGISTLFSRVT